MKNEEATEIKCWSFSGGTDHDDEYQLPYVGYFDDLIIVIFARSNSTLLRREFLNCRSLNHFIMHHTPSH